MSSRSSSVSSLDENIEEQFHFDLEELEESGNDGMFRGHTDVTILDQSRSQNDDDASTNPLHSKLRVAPVHHHFLPEKAILLYGVTLVALVDQFVADNRVSFPRIVIVKKILSELDSLFSEEETINNIELLFQFGFLVPLCALGTEKSAFGKGRAHFYASPSSPSSPSSAPPTSATKEENAFPDILKELTVNPWNFPCVRDLFFFSSASSPDENRQQLVSSSFASLLQNHTTKKSSNFASLEVVERFMSVVQLATDPDSAVNPSAFVSRWTRMFDKESPEAMQALSCDVRRILFPKAVLPFEYLKQCLRERGWKNEVVLYILLAKSQKQNNRAFFKFQYSLLSARFQSNASLEQIQLVSIDPGVRGRYEEHFRARRIEGCHRVMFPAMLKARNTVSSLKTVLDVFLDSATVQRSTLEAKLKMKGNMFALTPKALIDAGLLELSAENNNNDNLTLNPANKQRIDRMLLLFSQPSLMKGEFYCGRPGSVRRHIVMAVDVSRGSTKSSVFAQVRADCIREGMMISVNNSAEIQAACTELINDGVLIQSRHGAKADTAWFFTASLGDDECELDILPSFCEFNSSNDQNSPTEQVRVNEFRSYIINSLPLVASTAKSNFFPHVASARLDWNQDWMQDEWNKMVEAGLLKEEEDAERGATMISVPLQARKQYPFALGGVVLKPPEFNSSQKLLILAGTLECSLLDMLRNIGITSKKRKEKKRLLLQKEGNNSIDPNSTSCEMVTAVSFFSRVKRGRPTLQGPEFKTAFQVLIQSRVIVTETSTSQAKSNNQQKFDIIAAAARCMDHVMIISSETANQFLSTLRFHLQHSPPIEKSQLVQRILELPYSSHAGTSWKWEQVQDLIGMFITKKILYQKVVNSHNPVLNKVGPVCLITLSSLVRQSPNATVGVLLARCLEARQGPQLAATDDVTKVIPWQTDHEQFCSRDAVKETNSSSSHFVQKQTFTSVQQQPLLPTPPGPAGVSTFALLRQDVAANNNNNNNNSIESGRRRSRSPESKSSSSHSSNNLGTNTSIQLQRNEPQKYQLLPQKQIHSPISIPPPMLIHNGNALRRPNPGKLLFAPPPIRFR